MKDLCFLLVTWILKNGLFLFLKCYNYIVEALKDTKEKIKISSHNRLNVCVPPDL